MEAEQARGLSNRRGRARAPEAPVNGEAEHHEAPARATRAPAPALQAESKPVHTRRATPADERTHFTFSIELPIEWQGPLKRRSIDEQERGAFHCGGRENDAQALLRHMVREYCEEIVEESRKRHA